MHLTASPESQVRLVDDHLRVAVLALKAKQKKCPPDRPDIAKQYQRIDALLDRRLAAGS